MTVMMAQVRLAEGGRMVIKLNTDHTVAHIKQEIMARYGIAWHDGARILTPWHQGPGADQETLLHPEPGPPEQGAAGHRHHRRGEPSGLSRHTEAAVSEATDKAASIQRAMKGNHEIENVVWQQCF